MNVTVGSGTGGGSGITITTPLTANPDPATMGQQVGFNVKASSANNYALTYQFSYGDGSSDFNGIHPYRANGTYQASVTVTDGHNNSTTSTTTVNVGTAGNTAPVITTAAAASPNPTTVNQAVQVHRLGH